MKYERLEHFLLYHVLSFILVVIGLIALFRLLIYLHKSKKRNQKFGKKKTGKIQFPWEMKSAKQRRRKK